jgi:hypothetical protein
MTTQALPKKTWSVLLQKSQLVLSPGMSNGLGRISNQPDEIICRYDLSTVFLSIEDIRIGHGDARRVMARRWFSLHDVDQDGRALVRTETEVRNEYGTDFE